MDDADSCRNPCLHTQLTRTLVSAAIAGHMTEAVAGMTVWALATRGGGRPREGGDILQGVQTEGKGRREDGTPFPLTGDNHRFL